MNNETKNNLNDSLKTAQRVAAAGCPRRADVKTAQNLLYLASIGKAGGFQSTEAQGKQMGIVLKHDRFQSAQKAIANLQGLLSQRPRYKSQRRPA